jgi:plasmid maintenance system antidote protein VapI
VAYPDLPPVAPAELLQHEFLLPMVISAQELTAATAVPVEAILQGQPITADDDRRLCEHFGLGQGYWLRAQDYAQSIIDGMATPLSECSSEPGW